MCIFSEVKKIHSKNDGSKNDGTNNFVDTVKSMLWHYYYNYKTVTHQKFNVRFDRQ